MKLFGVVTRYPKIKKLIIGRVKGGSPLIPFYRVVAFSNYSMFNFFKFKNLKKLKHEKQNTKRKELMI